MNSDRKKILVVSYLPWNDETSTGNTLSNLFFGLTDKFEFACIYFKGGVINNGIANRYFYISEKELFKSIFSRHPVGEEIIYETKSNNQKQKTSNIYDKARAVRWDSLLLCQDIIGVAGKWKSNALDDFVKNYNPDLIFGPLGRVPISNIVMTYLNNKFEIPIITYAWDDHYSLNKRSLSIFFWIKTFFERKYIKQCAKASKFLYVITDQMKTEYAQYFNKECKVLYKAYDFGKFNHKKNIVNKPIKMIYMGNLGSGRWKELAKIVDAVKKINTNGKCAEIDIYSLSPKTKNIVNKLNVDGTARLMTPVDAKDILFTMMSADILIHVEPFNKKESLFYRLSFSTKIVDYFYSARCIVAFGAKNATMNYLKENNAAIIINDEDNLMQTLSALLTHPKRIVQYGINAWNCGVLNHQKDKIEKILVDDFNKVI